MREEKFKLGVLTFLVFHKNMFLFSYKKLFEAFQEKQSEK